MLIAKMISQHNNLDDFICLIDSILKQTVHDFKPTAYFVTTRILVQDPILSTPRHTPETASLLATRRKGQTFLCISGSQKKER